MSIDVAHLSFSYGSREILHDLSFSIPDGCLVNVLGPNGVGKSTLFRCILGLSPHYSGTILVNGKNLRALSVRERAREISYIPQSHAPVYDYEVVDVVLMATGNDLKMLATPGEAQLQRAHEALARIGIEHLAHRTYTQISGGEQQLVLIARALAQNAQHHHHGRAHKRARLRQHHARALLRAATRPRGALHRAIDPQPRSRLPVFGRHHGAFRRGGLRAFGNPHDVITSELISELYDIEVEVNSLYGDKVRVCVPVREIER